MEKFRVWMKWLGDGKWRYLAAGAGVLLAVIIVGLCVGGGGNGENAGAGGVGGNLQDSVGGLAGSQQAGAGGAAGNPAVGTGGASAGLLPGAEEVFTLPEEPEPLPVSEEEAALLSGIYQAMEQGDYAAAAAILNGNEEALRTLVQETLGGVRYCYFEETSAGADGESGGFPQVGTFSDGGFEGTAAQGMDAAGENVAGETAAEGAGAALETIPRMLELPAAGPAHGLVVTRYNTVFFGDFQDGKPEGTCAAIQAMILDEPRYTYAVGIWAGGRLNGEGKTGYHCYESSAETTFARTEKSGVYADNLLDGPFQYATENGAGECLHWDMEAAMGVTVLTDAWIHYENRGEYMLPSNEDPSRVYALKEEQAGAVLWNNLLLWDEP